MSAGMVARIAFVRARLDEDEVAAKAWQSPPWGEDATHWKMVGSRELRYDNGCRETLSVIDVSGRDLDWAEAIQVKWDSNGERVRHIASHDPDRTLREVATWRRILLEYSIPPGMDAVYGGTERETGFRLALSFAIKAKALEWKDHPDYREWES